MKTQTYATREARAVSPFVAALRVAILRQVAILRADRVQGMSVENLRQLVKAPSHMLDGAPRGTNAGYFYAEIFAEEARRMVADFLLSNSTRRNSP